MTRGGSWSFRGLTRARVACAAGLVALVFGATAASPRTVHAADPVDVESLIRQGVELRKKERDQEALGFFKRAHDLDRSPRTAAQLGLAELQLGYAVAAEQHLSEALAASRHLWVVRNRVQLAAALAQAKASVGELDIGGSPAGAEVLINGKVAGKLPLAAPVRVGEGLIQIAVRADGFKEAVKSVQVTGGGRDILVFALVPGAGATAAATRALSQNGSQPRDSAGAEDRVLDDALAAHDRNQPAGLKWVRPAAWVASVVSASALGAGAYGLWRLHKSETAFNGLVTSGTGEHVCSTAALEDSDPRCKEYHREVRASERLARVALPTAGVFAAAAIMGFIWSTRDEGAVSQGRRPSLHAAVERSGFTMSVQAPF